MQILSLLGIGWFILAAISQSKGFAFLSTDPRLRSPSPSVQAFIEPQPDFNDRMFKETSSLSEELGLPGVYQSKRVFASFRSINPALIRQSTRKRLWPTPVLVPMCRFFPRKLSPPSDDEDDPFVS